MSQGRPGVLSFPKDIICGHSMVYDGSCPSEQLISYWGGLANNFSECFSCDTGQYAEDNNFGLPTHCESGYFVCAKSYYNIYTYTPFVYNTHIPTQVYTPSICCRIGQLCKGDWGAHRKCLDLPPSALNLTDPTFNRVTSSKAVASTTALIGGTEYDPHSDKLTHQVH